MLSVALCSQGFAETLLGGCGCAMCRAAHVHRAQKPAPRLAPQRVASAEHAAPGAICSVV